MNKIKKLIFIILIIAFPLILNAENIWILLDSSASLSPKNAQLRNEGAIILAILFHESNKNNKIGVIDFAKKLRILEPTTNLDEIINFISKIGRKGLRTDIEKALRKIMNYPDSLVFLFTDGRIDINKDGLDAEDLISRKRVLKEVLPILKANNIKVYCVGLKSKSLDIDFLNRISFETTKISPLVAESGKELKEKFYKIFGSRIRYRLNYIVKGDKKYYKLKKIIDEKYSTLCKDYPSIIKGVKIIRRRGDFYIFQLKNKTGEVEIPTYCNVKPINSILDYEILSPDIVRSRYYFKEKLLFKLKVFPKSDSPEIINLFKEGKVKIKISIFDSKNPQNFYKIVKLKKVKEDENSFIYSSDPIWLDFKNCQRIPNVISFQFKVKFLTDKDSRHDDIIFPPKQYETEEKQVFRLIIKQPVINRKSIWKMIKRTTFFENDLIDIKIPEKNIINAGNFAQIKKIEFYFNNKKINYKKEDGSYIIKYKFSHNDIGKIDFYSIIYASYREKTIDDLEDVIIKYNFAKFEIKEEPFKITCALNKKNNIFYAGTFFKNIKKLEIPFNIDLDYFNNIRLYFTVTKKHEGISLLKREFHIEKNKKSFVLPLKINPEKLGRENFVVLAMSSDQHVLSKPLVFEVFFVKYPFYYIIAGIVALIILIIILFYLLLFLKYKKFKGLIMEIKKYDMDDIEERDYYKFLKFNILNPFTILKVKDDNLNFEIKIELFGNKLIFITYKQIDTISPYFLDDNEREYNLINKKSQLTKYKSGIELSFFEAKVKIRYKKPIILMVKKN